MLFIFSSVAVILVVAHIYSINGCFQNTNFQASLPINPQPIKLQSGNNITSKSNNMNKHLLRTYQMPGSVRLVFLCYVIYISAKIPSCKFHYHLYFRGPQRHEEVQKYSQPLMPRKLTELVSWNSSALFLFLQLWISFSMPKKWEKNSTMINFGLSYMSNSFFVVKPSKVVQIMTLLLGVQIIKIKTFSILTHLSLTHLRKLAFIQ